MRGVLLSQGVIIRIFSISSHLGTDGIAENSGAGPPIRGPRSTVRPRGRSSPAPAAQKNAVGCI